MSMAYIRDYYGVPAHRGGRVRFDYVIDGTPGPHYGVIRGSRDQYLRVRVPGFKHLQSMHPTWMVTYLSEPSGTRVYRLAVSWPDGVTPLRERRRNYLTKAGAEHRADILRQAGATVTVRASEPIHFPIHTATDQGDQQ